MKTVKLSDGEKYNVLNPKEDKCPICETELKNVGFSWRMFHGEAESTCCGAVYQIKSWYVEPKEGNQDIIDFSNSLDDSNKIWFKINEEYIILLREALNETGCTRISDDECYNLFLKKIDESENVKS